MSSAILNTNRIHLLSQCQNTRRFANSEQMNCNSKPAGKTRSELAVETANFQRILQRVWWNL
jgi:hypothetical protein